MSKRGIGTSSLFISLSILALAACQKSQDQADEPQPRGGKVPEVVKPWGEMGLHRFSELRWEQGADTFEGVEIAIVGADPASGSTAMYVKVPRKQMDERLHVHSTNSHSVVLDGEVSVLIDGKKMTGKKGDYFFTPANLVHSDSIIDLESGATMFMITEGKFDTQFATPDVKLPAPDLESWGAAQLHSPERLEWVQGEGTFESVRTAVVGKNRRTGAAAMFMQLEKKEPDKRLHYHTAATHTIVVDGQVSAFGPDGEMMTMDAGDYFRGAENWVHSDSSSDVGALMFSLNEGELGTVFVDQ